MGCQFYVNICFKDETMSFHFDSISWNNLNNKSVVLGGEWRGVFTTQTLSIISVFYVDGIAHCFLILTACLLLLRSQIYCSWFDCKPQVNVRCIFSVSLLVCFGSCSFMSAFSLSINHCSCCLSSLPDVRRKSSMPNPGKHSMAFIHRFLCKSGALIVGCRLKQKICIVLLQITVWHDVTFRALSEPALKCSCTQNNS